MKNILVAGGAGFIGSNLCKELLKIGHNVYCVDNLSSGSIKNIMQLKNKRNFHFIETDINHNLNINVKIDEIYNLACPASPKNYQRDSIFTLDTNYIGVKNLLDFALRNDCKILQASTSEIYGNPLVHPQNESYFGNVNTIGPRSCYDEGKRIAETLFFEYKKKYSLEAKIVRIFNTYGPNLAIDDGRVISNFINQALRNDSITIYGNGNQTRSFCYIDDLVNGLILMMDKQNLFGPINLGNPIELRIRDIAELIIKLTNSESSIIFQEIPQDDPEKRKPDIVKANELLNWFPKVSLEEGLLSTIKHFRDILLEMHNEI